MTAMTMTTTASVVDRLLAAIAGGRGGDVVTLFGADAVLDATVAGQRLHLRGNRAIGNQCAAWFRASSRFEELDRRPTEEGEVVAYLLTWQEDGVPHGAHQCHVLTVGDDGLIASDRFFCGGPWDAGQLAAMEEADRG